MVNWQTLFMVSLRRQGSSSRYRYKFNMENITHQVFPRCKQAFKKTNLSYEYCDLEGVLYNISLTDLQKLLLRDINAPREHAFKIVRTDLTQKSSKKRIQHWERIAPMFDHPLSLYEKLFSEMDEDFKPSFEWQQLIRVRCKDDKLKLQRVIWPKSIFSNFCRGIGVKKNTYDRLLEQNNGEVPMFVNPANAKPLPLFQVSDEAMIGEFDGIGIFPYFVDKHREFFVTEVDKLKTKIASPLCTLNERKRIEKANAGRILANEEGKPFYLDANSATTRIADGNVVTLKQLLERSVSHKTLWSKQSNKDRTCPGDILRATILSNDFSIRQLRAEFCKNFILYNIFTILQRNKKSIRSFSGNGNAPSFPFSWNVWDSYIWKQYQETESMKIPTDQASLINYKTKYDSFLHDLQTYSALVISEMKWNQFSIFQNDETTLSRFEHITLILQTVLTKSKMIRIFQPNLYKFMQDDLRPTLMELVGFTESINATIEPGFANEQSLQSANGLKKLANQLLYFEQKIYGEKFRVNRPIQLRPITLSANYKIVILDKKNAIPEIFQTLLKFMTQITTYFVKDLSEVELHGHMHCIDKKMLDKSKFMYLYEEKSNEEVKAASPQKEKIVDNIIGLLSNDEEH